MCGTYEETTYKGLLFAFVQGKVNAIIFSSAVAFTLKNNFVQIFTTFLRNILDKILKI